MENKEIKDEAQKVAEAISGFASFLGGALDSVVDNAPEADKESLRAQVDRVKNGEFKEVQDKLAEVNVQLGKIK